MDPALALARRGLHLFVEKPVSHSLDRIPELLDLVEQKKLTAMTGFCMRFFQPLQKAKELLTAGRVGRLVTARSFTGVYLPDWHPYEDYRSFYMAKKDQGGGVLLDECHAFDWMQWLCGPITAVCAVVGTFSDLEVETDDVCEALVRFGARVGRLDPPRHGGPVGAERGGADRHREHGAGGPRGPHRALLRPQGAEVGELELRARLRPHVRGRDRALLRLRRARPASRWWTCGPAIACSASSTPARARAPPGASSISTSARSSHAGRPRHRPPRREGPEPRQGHPPRGPARHGRSPASSPSATTRRAPTRSSTWTSWRASTAGTISWRSCGAPRPRSSCP